MATANTPDKKKRVTLTSPKGESLFAHVVDVDYGTDKYPDENGSFNLTLALDEEAAATMDALLEPHVEEARAVTEERFAALKPASRKKLGEAKFNDPGPEEYDKEGDPTGRRLFRFKTAAFFENRQGVKVQRKVPLFDSMQQPVKLTEEPGNGSVMRVAFTPMPYFVDGQGMGGLTLYLNTVQIIKLNRFGERSAADYGFGAEEGGFTSGDDMDETTSPKDVAETPAPDDDVPQF